jgi:cell wall assembly regulator SMI1
MDLAALFAQACVSTGSQEIQLNPPATDADLASLASVIGQAVPEQLAALLRLANGETAASDGLFGGDSLLSTEGIGVALSWYEAEIGDLPDDGRYFGDCPFVKQGRCWNPKWIPLVFGHAQTTLFFDSDPSDRGIFGQLIMSAQIDGDCGIVATSIEDLLKRMSQLEEGTLPLHYPFIDPQSDAILPGANSMI